MSLILRVQHLVDELRGDRYRLPPQQERSAGVVLAFLGWSCEFGEDCAYPGLGWRCGHLRYRSRRREVREVLGRGPMPDLRLGDVVEVVRDDHAMRVTAMAPYPSCAYLVECATCDLVVHPATPDPVRLVNFHLHCARRIDQ